MLRSGPEQLCRYAPAESSPYPALVRRLIRGREWVRIGVGFGMQATTVTGEPAETQAQMGALKTRGVQEAPAASSSPCVPTVLRLLHLAAYVVVGGAYDPRVTAAIAAGATVVSAEMAGEHQNIDTPSPAHNPATSPYPG